jgi:hypothetical protein
MHTTRRQILDSCYSLQINQLILDREIIAFCYEICTQHINTAVWAERRIIYKDPVRTAQ